ncbi:MAG: hypothetical protein HYY44_04655 [Deltaproteobacteria bacterium]|nr:hypothetical protein [Deltaproteobacteria bacterium]
MDANSSEWIKISARMPKDLLDRLSRIHPKESLSELLRSLIEREIVRQKVLKAHMKLYGRFKPDHFDESLL